jgi:hypothetical protein
MTTRTCSFCLSGPSVARSEAGCATAGGEADNGCVNFVLRALDSDVPDLLSRHDAWTEIRIQAVGEGRAQPEQRWVGRPTGAEGPYLRLHRAAVP